MKIGVLLKQVPDSETKVRVNGDATGIEEGDIKWIVSPYDEYAVEAAIQLKEKVGDSEVVVLSMGPARCLDAARTALAMGADRAVILDDDGFAGSDTLGVARSLAAAISKEELDVVFAGCQAIDGDSGAVPQMTAALLEWPHATWINSFEHEGETATIKRNVGGGNVEVARLRYPALFSCTKGLNEPRYASLPGIMKAKRKPVARYSPGDLDVVVGADNSETTLSDFRLPPARSAGRILQGELRDQVRELVKALREEAKVL